MGESDDKLTKVSTNGSSGLFERFMRMTKELGFPIVVTVFLLWEWHTVVSDLKLTMGEVKFLLQDVREQLKKGHP